MRGLHPSPAAGIIPPLKLRPDADGGISFPRTEAASSSELRENFRTLNEALSDLYFPPNYRAGDGAFGGGGGVIPNLASNVIFGASTVEFPATAGGTAAWRITQKILPRWRNVGLRMSIEYSAVAGSVNSFVFVVRARRLQAGDVMPTGMDLNVNLTLPGPAVAQTIMEYVYVNNDPAVLPGDRPWMSWTFIRDKTNAADTNANSLHVLAVRVEVIEL